MIAISRERPQPRVFKIATELEQSREFKRSTRVTPFIQNLLNIRVLRFSSCAWYPKGYYSLKPTKKHRYSKPKKGRKRQDKAILSNSACEYLWNKQVEVAKVCEITKENSEFRRRV